MNEKIAAIETARMSLDELRPHPRNPRKHPEPGSKMWEIMKRSLDRSYFEPLVWNRRNGCLVSGHLRLKVLKEMGYAQADVSVVDLAEGSANLRSSDNIEQIVITNDPDTLAFHTAWMEELPAV
ncbi:MAG TPA: hypothetical protein PK490_12270 [Prosthecobacter sp.]|nr:hypothetical protein [Prosthecobacter sp.]HRK15062.1 hypothetical protein [Prosthecobacter sp.]